MITYVQKTAYFYCNVVYIIFDYKFQTVLFATPYR